MAAFPIKCGRETVLTFGPEGGPGRFTLYKYEDPPAGDPLGDRAVVRIGGSDGPVGTWSYAFPANSIADHFDLVLRADVAAPGGGDVKIWMKVANDGNPDVGPLHPEDGKHSQLGWLLGRAPSGSYRLFGFRLFCL